MNSKIAVIELGYIGLPLVHMFSEKYEVVGHEAFKVFEHSDYIKISTDKPVLIDIKGVVENPTWRL